MTKITVSQEKMTNKIVKNNFDSVFERIKSETGLKSIRQLAVIIGKRQQTISAAKAKDEFSAAWAYIVAVKYGLLTEWIMTGNGPKRLEGIKDGLDFYEELEQWARETGGPNTAWLKSQIESFFPMFKEWKKRREEGEENKPGFPSSKVAQ